MAGGRESREAFVTLATNDTYSLGCLVLGNSLRNVAKTTRQLVVMVTQGVSQSMRNQLSRVFDMIYDVNLLDSRDSANLQLLGRPDLSCTFTKLHCWRLTMYDKAVFLDADTLVLQNVDELFDREELSAAPDAGWPDCFNSGVFVFQPSEETYNSLLNYAMSQGSFDGGDQGLLNMYFRDWATKDINKHLPFIYNVVSQAFYSYLPAFTQFKQDVKIVHFIGATKPWHHPYNTSSGEVTPLPETGHSKEFLQRWWNIFMQFVQPFLDPSLTHHVGGLIGDLAAMRVHSPESMGSDQSLLSDQERKLNWERGQMDYLGADKFENIQAKLDKSLKGPPSSSDYTSSPFRPPTDGPPSEGAKSKPESSPAPAPEVVSPPKNEPAKTESSTPAPAPDAKQTTASAASQKTEAANKQTTTPVSAASQKTEAANKQTTAPAPAASQKTEAVKKQTTTPVVTKVSQPATTTSSVAKPQATVAGTAATKPQATKPAPQSEASKTAQPKTTAATPSTAKPGLKTEVPKAGGAPSAFSKPAAQPSSGSTAAAKSPTSSSAPSGKGGIASRLPWLKK